MAKIIHARLRPEREGVMTKRFPTSAIAKRDAEIVQARAAFEAAVASGHCFDMTLVSRATGERLHMCVTEDQATDQALDGPLRPR